MYLKRTLDEEEFQELLSRLFRNILSSLNLFVILLLNPTNQLVPRFHRGHRKRAKRGWERRDKRPRAETEVHRGRQTLEASDGLIALAAATMPPS